MNRKIYFSILFLINIAFGIYLIFALDTTFEKMVDDVPSEVIMQISDSEFEASMQEFKTSYFMVFLLQIIISIFGFIYTNKSNILKRKGFFIVFLLIFAIGLAEFNIISQVLCLINIFSAFVLVFMKREKEEDYPKKRNLPALDEFELKKYEKICSLVLTTLYLTIIFVPFGRFVKSLSENAKTIIEISIYLIFILFTIIIFRRKFIRDFKHLFKNFLDYFLPSMKIFALVLIVYFVITSIIHIGLNVPVPKNEEKVESLNIYFILFGACIYAPIVEENIFRNILHVFIKNKKIFIILSSFTFGLLHTFDEGSLYLALVQAIPYSILGFFFAFNYSKTNNIAHTMVWHASWNLITVIISFMLTF